MKTTLTSMVAGFTTVQAEGDKASALAPTVWTEYRLNAGYNREQVLKAILADCVCNVTWPTVDGTETGDKVGQNKASKTGAGRAWNCVRAWAAKAVNDEGEIMTGAENRVTKAKSAVKTAEKALQDEKQAIADVVLARQMAYTEARQSMTDDELVAVWISRHGGDKKGVELFTALCKKALKTSL